MKTEIFLVKAARASKPGKYFEDAYDQLTDSLRKVLKHILFSETQIQKSCFNIL